MPDTIRVGLVGSRFAAEFHWEGYQRVHTVPVRVAGVVSRTRESAEAFARPRGLPVFDSISEMAGHVDLVDICSPPSTHETLAIEALEHGTHVVIEKPFTGFFGPDSTTDARPFEARDFPKGAMLAGALDSCRRILDAAKIAGRRIFYAENWVYAPAIAKEREILQKTGGQVLWIAAGESHSGSHSKYYGIWKHSGGGSLMGKGCHPLSAALHLKRAESEARGEAPIRPATLSARVHSMTRMPGFRDAGFLRTDYHDTEDYAQLHVTFDDGTVADIFASELVLGGVHNWLEVFANNHRTRCNLNPIDALETYNPREEQFRDIYVTEKIGTKQGWSRPAPDESWQHGYPQEFQDFVECAASGRAPLSGGELARDTIAAIYAGYLSAERHGAEVGVIRV